VRRCRRRQPRKPSRVRMSITSLRHPRFAAELLHARAMSGRTGGWISRRPVGRCAACTGRTLSRGFAPRRIHFLYQSLVSGGLRGPGSTDSGSEPPTLEGVISVLDFLSAPSERILRIAARMRPPAGRCAPDSDSKPAPIPRDTVRCRLCAGVSCRPHHGAIARGAGFVVRGSTNMGPLVRRRVVLPIGGGAEQLLAHLVRERARELARQLRRVEPCSGTPRILKAMKTVDFYPNQAPVRGEAHSRPLATLDAHSAATDRSSRAGSGGPQTLGGAACSSADGGREHPTAVGNGDLKLKLATAQPVVGKTIASGGAETQPGPRGSACDAVDGSVAIAAVLGCDIEG